MIEKITIRNFKSIVDLTLDLGRFNVIIGTNGCGKTNILEAITFASAASQDKLDSEYLINRDIRITESQFMVNAFDDVDINDNKVIKAEIAFSSADDVDLKLFIAYEEISKRWMRVPSNIEKIHSQDDLKKYKDDLIGIFNILKENRYSLSKLSESYPYIYDYLNASIFLSNQPELSSFLTYRPSETYLRRIYDSPIYPLGIKGEGLLQYLKNLGKNNENIKLFSEINEGLHLLEWFESMSIPEDLLSNEYKLSIEDKYLRESMRTFDQRSTNEGFLYLLFYLTLFNSKDTPSFFAIDNIETAFNPKLCTRLTEYLTDASEKNNKQVIITTHNPYILDGLDLANDNIRLFVARRDIDGHTKLERINYRVDRKMPLSELWMSGLIGGLPDNF